MSYDDGIKRMYYFRDSSDAPFKGFEWVRKTGGTALVDSKRTLRDSFDLDTDRKFKSFENACRTDGITLASTRGGFDIGGRRLFMLYPDKQDLEAAEERLAKCYLPTDVEEILVLVWNDSWVVDWVKRYGAKLIGDAPDGWLEKVDVVDTSGMPADIVEILELIAMKARTSDNKLPWQEKDQLKSDMMKNMVYWRTVTPEQVKEKCFELGMSVADGDEVAGMLQRRLDGHRFQVRSSYGDFEFMHGALLDSNE